jgi:hypothetical protein
MFTEYAALRALAKPAVALTFTLKRAYTRPQFEQFFRQTKFRSVDIRGDALGFKIWMEK